MAQQAEVTVRVLSAANIVGMNIDGTSNVFFTVEVGRGKTEKTAVVEETVAPKYDLAAPPMKFTGVAIPTIATIKAFNQVPFSETLTDFLGQATLSLLMAESTSTKTLPLTHGGNVALANKAVGGCGTVVVEYGVVVAASSSAGQSDATSARPSMTSASGAATPSAPVQPAAVAAAPVPAVAATSSSNDALPWDVPTPTTAAAAAPPPPPPPAAASSATPTPAPAAAASPAAPAPQQQVAPVHRASPAEPSASTIVPLGAPPSSSFDGSGATVNQTMVGTSAVGATVEAPTPATAPSTEAAAHANTNPLPPPPSASHISPLGSSQAPTVGTTPPTPAPSAVGTTPPTPAPSAVGATGATTTVRPGPLPTVGQVTFATHHPPAAAATAPAPAASSSSPPKAAVAAAAKPAGRSSSAKATSHRSTTSSGATTTRPTSAAAAPKPTASLHRDVTATSPATQEAASRAFFKAAQSGVVNEFIAYRAGDPLLRGPLLSKYRDYAGRSVLHVAAWHGHIGVLHELLRPLGSTNVPQIDWPNLVSKSGNTVLHTAAESGRVEVVQYLLQQRGAHVLNSIRNARGECPTDVALWYRQPAAAELLQRFSSNELRPVSA